MSGRPTERRLAMAVCVVIGAAVGQACALGAYIEVGLIIAVISPASVPSGTDLGTSPHVWWLGSTMLLAGVVGSVVALRRGR